MLFCVAKTIKIIGPNLSDYLPTIFISEKRFANILPTITQNGVKQEGTRWYLLTSTTEKI